MIVATAGHVDHGKTALVQALTGVNTDRLPEEQRRGLTIEPGYAHAHFGGARPISFVDVPGHERFLRQMIAGVAAVDAVLLVVAADDGPMPQTREHLAVLDLLGLRRAALVISKIDRVDAARVAAVSAQAGALLQGSTLAGAPSFAVSVRSGAGLADLRDHLAVMQRQLPDRPALGGLRVGVDRCFTRDGAGVVVTGAVLSGQVHLDDELCVSPAGQPVRVRGLQVHGQPVVQAQAGQRCALNLAGAERPAVARGDWLVAPSLHAPTQRLDVRLQLLPDAARALTGSLTLQLYLGAASLPVRALPLQPRRLEPGSSGWVQLLLSVPVSALRGDRFVLRDPAAQALLGGGEVIDPFAPARGRASAPRLADLAALALDPAAALAALLAQHPEGIEWPPLVRSWNLDAAQAQRLRDAVAHHSVLHAQGQRWLAPAAWQAVLQGVDGTLAAWHAEQPHALGPDEAALQSALSAALGKAVDGPVRRAALRQRLADGAVIRQGFRLRLPTHAPMLGSADEVLLQRLHSVMRPRGLRPPPLGELAPLLDLERPAAADFLQRAAALGHLVQVAKNRFFLPETLDALVQVLRATAAAAPDGRFDAAAFRDRSGVGRNLSIQLLEFFDRQGITRYARQRRVIAEPQR